MNLSELLVSDTLNPLPCLQLSKLILICIRSILGLEYDISLITQIKKNRVIEIVMHLLCSNDQQAITIFAHLPHVAQRFRANQKCIRILVSQVMTHVHIPGGPANFHWW